MNCDDPDFMTEITFPHSVRKTCCVHERQAPVEQKSSYNARARLGAISTEEEVVPGSREARSSRKVREGTLEISEKSQRSEVLETTLVAL